MEGRNEGQVMRNALCEERKVVEPLLSATAQPSIRYSSQYQLLSLR
jgi:hypothetical protein